MVIDKSEVVVQQASIIHKQIPSKSILPYVNFYILLLTLSVTSYFLIFLILPVFSVEKGTGLYSMYPILYTMYPPNLNISLFEIMSASCSIFYFNYQKLKSYIKELSCYMIFSHLQHCKGPASVIQMISK